MEDDLTRSMQRASWILACVLPQPDRAWFKPSSNWESGQMQGLVLWHITFTALVIAQSGWWAWRWWSRRHSNAT